MNYKESVPERFRATYDKVSDRWLILDMWHEQIQNLPQEFTQTIPDNHPAMKIISGGEFNALLKELKKMNRPDAQIIKEDKSIDIINKEYISNVDIANILDKISKNLRERKTSRLNRGQ